MREIPTLAGLLTAAVLMLCTLNLVPALHCAWPWQLLAVVTVGITDLVIWKRTNSPPMGWRAAAIQGSIGFGLVATLAMLDTLWGYAFGARTLGEAFIGSGAAGGAVDLFLLASMLFVGVPTLVRAVAA